ncbi:MBL fold metallo-hydrolase [Prosthecobacter sp.]|uniref:MBL fold metallo-hydrolase n=1 Tax=Prosthecobacter sp. TaxID=1965333 RepID=UPI002AB806D5|nr:MBL fold metallo-hydrolase [Prosthecobacter sp.]MDZ4405960.1 MBL fold metallo-hydrolase [Prosthecobacter sp.]
MLFDPASSSGGAGISSPAKKRTLLGRTKTEGNRIGLLPTEGWRKRNMQFLNEVLIPSLLSPRKPGQDFGLLPIATQDEIAVTWLGHAGFFAQVGGINIAIDPNWALWHGPVKRLRHPSVWAHDLPPIDLVLVTHAHYDHLHLPSLRKLAAAQPIIVPEGVGQLVKNCGFGRIVELKTWQSATFRDLRITLTPARHWGARMIHDTHRQFGGFLIKSPDRCLYHCGDSAMFDGFQEIGKRADIDLALMPIGAYDAPSGRPVHMNPEEALDAFEMLGANSMVPMHHETFPLGGEPIHEPAERLVKAALERQMEHRVRLLREGESAIY